MAASLFGANLTFSSTDSAIASAPRSSGVMEACNKPMRQRCEEIGAFIQMSSSKELHSVYPLLLDSIFGYNQNPGWGLHAATQQTFRDDYRMLHEFLSPHGHLMTMVYKLQADPALRYEFPVSNLPAPTRDAILEGAMPGLYAHKLGYPAQGRLPTTVSLTAFEYFMYNFAYLIVHRHKQESLQQWTDADDWLYPNLLNDYLHYFLPIDGSSVPPAPFVTSTQTHNLGQGHSPPYRFSADSQHSSLFRSNTTSCTSSHHHLRHPLQLTQRQPPFGLHQSSAAVDCGGNRETWRSEVLLQALGEFWLSQNTLQPKEQGFRQHVRENYIPSSDHVRVVRILVKHLHFFVNSARPPLAISAYQQPEQEQMDDLKRYVIPRFIQKKLYVFLRHGFDNWPLDSTFRQILEVWLSYIQPWRYTEQMRAADRSPVNPREMAKDRPIQEERWLKFVSCNLLFYTVLFQEFLPRAFRQDLTGPKNAIVLFRVAKVFAQSNLAHILEEAERRLIEDYQAPLRGRTGSFGSSFISPLRIPSSPDLGSQIAELEAPGFAYQPLFGDVVKLSINRLLQAVHQACITVSNMNYTPVANPNEGFFSWLGLGDLTSGSQGSYGQHQLQDDIAPADTHKLSGYLKLTVDYLCKVFQVSAPSVAHDSVDGGSGGGVGGQENDLPPECINGKLTPRGRYQLMNGLRKFEITYQGDPDLQPIRSYENAFLVRKLHALSTSINETFSDKILELYHRPDFTGAVAKQFFHPPPVIPTHKQTPKRSLSYSPTPTRALDGRHHDRPRVSLRFLASYYTIAKLVVVYLCLWLMGFGPVGALFVFAVLLVLYGVVGGAVGSLRQDKKPHEHLD
ncbi:sphingomyelin phosphodiesterase 4-like isoform X2 [Acanthaster planci]|uniref:Sphingomyelin phosphodiesterase 4-like isoform X2 n=1 Tax=Acanthaster planci TaxID=133434 RepID=A0A8B7YU20_ACAPL|nr:sphingomyelin phosphodiesterase 4-like isoform X2 [Acanthaster planci]